jgi:hypothetical protein
MWLRIADPVLVKRRSNGHIVYLDLNCNFEERRMMATMADGSIDDPDVPFLRMPFDCDVMDALAHWEVEEFVDPDDKSQFVRQAMKRTPVHKS